MSADERLDRLERRLHDLEELVLDVQAALHAANPPVPSRQRTPASAAGSHVESRRAALSDSAPESAAPSRPVRAPSSGLRPVPGDVPPAPRRSETLGASRTEVSSVSRPPPILSAEQWIGQRGLLAAGVSLLILATGYFLKLAFDRGWIAPQLRCTGGALLGLGVAAVGWHLHERRALRTYGAALIGCGAGIVYLALWAAVRLYDLLPPTIGLGLMATLSLATFGVANVVNVEALAAAAALGAFLAPVVIGRSGNPDVLLIYAFFLALALGAVARRRWRLTTFLIALSFFALGAGATTGSHATPAYVLIYAVIGASAGLHIGLKQRWTETRFLAFWGGWALLTSASGNHAIGLLIAAGGLILAGPIWRYAWHAPSVWPDEEWEASPGPARAESLYFYATPLWLAWGVALAAPAWFARHDWGAPLVVAVAYVASGYGRLRIPFAIVGTTAAALAVLQAWSGTPAVWGLLALATLWAALDHAFTRDDGRWYACLALATATAHLLFVDAASRPFRAPAFVDGWAFALWGTIGVLVLMAGGLFARTTLPTPASPPAPNPYWRSRDLNHYVSAEWVPAYLWTAAGALLFWGMTNELTRYFHQTALSPATARLAGGLAVSTWWALFAAGLILYGFRRNLKPVRVAGLAVSGLAVAKVLLFDLAELDALYRIASVFILSVVSLGVAYLYHRQGRTAQGPDPTDG